jgi:hypothetical protein
MLALVLPVVMEQHAQSKVPNDSTVVDVLQDSLATNVKIRLKVIAYPAIKILIYKECE